MATASGAWAQTDTAYVPFIVNAESDVRAVFTADGSSDCIDAGAGIYVDANTQAILRIPLQDGENVGVRYGAQKTLTVPAIVGNGAGKVTLNLPAQSYKNAEIAMYSVNGKRIMRQKASADGSANSLIRMNIAPGAYLLSVKGADGVGFTSRLTHSGGNLAITVAFGGENRPAVRQLAKEAAGPCRWRITVDGEWAGYSDTSYWFNPVSGVNPVQYITLTQYKYWVEVLSLGTGAGGSGSYAEGAIVSINAGTRPSGQQFIKWTATSGGVTFASANSATTTFIMPANAVTVTANFEGDSGTFTDSRDGKNYRFVTIGGMKWTAKNLNYQTDSSWCYNDSDSYCDRYGRLYNWNAAKSACPSGWHLPSRDEWRTLLIAARGDSLKFEPSITLLSTSGWSSWGGNNHNGSDKYGFSALPGGSRSPGGYFSGAGTSANMWTATAYVTNTAYYQATFSEQYGEVGRGHSVRCVGD
jgi:uncharacterized protein (TIGR02145 family)